MASSTKFSSTYPGLSTPPHPQSDSSPIDFSQFAEVDRDDQRADSRNGESNKRVGNKRLGRPSSAEPKTALVFRGKPLAMELYKPKRKRVARLPDQLPKKSDSRRVSNVSSSVAGPKADNSRPQVDGSRPANRNRRRRIRLGHPHRVEVYKSRPSPSPLPHRVKSL